MVEVGSEARDGRSRWISGATPLSTPYRGVERSHGVLSQFGGSDEKRAVEVFDCSPPLCEAARVVRLHCEFTKAGFGSRQRNLARPRPTFAEGRVIARCAVLYLSGGNGCFAPGGPISFFFFDGNSTPSSQGSDGLGEVKVPCNCFKCRPVGRSMLRHCVS